MHRRLTSMTILIADDDTDDRLFMDKALRQSGYMQNIQFVEDGEELMEYLRREGRYNEQNAPWPNLLILDLNMPRKNGVECLKEIRSTKKFKDIPVVIFSTSSLQASIEQVYNEGANFYVKKPGSFPKLKKAIEQILDTDWNNQKFGMSMDRFYFTF